MGTLDAPGLSAKAALAGQLVPIANRAAPAFQTGSGLSDGVLLGGTAVMRHKALRTAYGIRLVFTNHYPVSSGGAVETNGTDPITVKASIESPTTQLFPVTFGGASSVVIAPGASVMSDPIGITIAKGTLFWTRTYVVVTAGQKWPRGAFSTFSASGQGHNYASGAAGADVTASGAAPTGGLSEYVYGPSAVLGLPADPGKAVVAIVGDSIAAGSSDNQVGWIERWLNDNYAYQKVAYPSEAMTQWDPTTAGGAYCYRRAALLAREGVTHVIAEHIVNDLGASSLPTLQARAFRYWTFLSRVGKVLATTCTPQTTSTDGWVTTGNQTVASPGTNEPRRLGWNAWVRDGAPMNAAGAAQAVGDTAPTTLRAGQAGHPLSGYIEVADAAESARDSGIWKANYTSDGTHPNPTGAAAMAAALPTPIGYLGNASI
jgi:lysophospholipase L1-like esterase